jgi:hypothetical protein
MAPGAKINGTTVKEGISSLVPVMNAAGLPATLETGKTYQIVGSVTIDGAVTVPAEVTLLIPAGAKLTATGITGAGTVIVEAGGSATGMPSFSTDKITDTQADANTDLEEVTIASTKNLATGSIDIKLYGEVEDGLSEGAVANIWTAAGSGKPAGNWSWVVIDNLLPEPVAGDMDIKQTNDSFRYYTGKGDEHVSTTPIESAKAEAPQIYIPATGSPYKWKKYTLTQQGDTIKGQPADTANNGFGVLLWSAAPSKTATIAIARPSTNPTLSYTVIVDWSGLKINPAE